MTDQSSCVVVLGGAGGGAPDLTVLNTGTSDVTTFEVIAYPGWTAYVADGFSARKLITDLADQIERRVPQGSIRIVGISLGGHLGYAAALELQARGRDVVGFCAIDTFMVSSAAPSSGWITRAAEHGLGLIRKRRLDEFQRFLRSRFWRASLRLTRDRLPGLLRSFATSGRLPLMLGFDPLFQFELNMRLLLWTVAPLIASLDREPVPLRAPAILLRTPSASRDDIAWRRRCPNINIIEIPGAHDTLFDPENITALRESFTTAKRRWR
jgi:thioesterase domain-containing protein